jgi:hypothetical protein
MSLVQGLLPGITTARCGRCRKLRHVHSRRLALCRPCHDQLRPAPPGARGQRGEPTPTPHLPGSPEKVLELMRRYAANEELWHPGDAKHATR